MVGKLEISSSHPNLNRKKNPSVATHMSLTLHKLRSSLIHLIRFIK